MSYKAVVFRVAIASPTDVNGEREMARGVIHEWNDVHSLSRRIVLLPVGWETHTHPAMGDRPQEIVNHQAMENCDLLIGIFWKRLGTPTGEYASGTVEEITNHAAAGKPVMLYFSQQPPPIEVLEDDAQAKQYRSLCSFRDECKSKSLFQTYEDPDCFEGVFRRHLQQLVNENPIFRVTIPDQKEADGKLISGRLMSAYEKPKLQKEAVTMLIEAGKEVRDGTIIKSYTLGGFSLHCGDVEFVSIHDSHREQKRWEAALEELVEYGLVSVGTDRQVYELTNRGYEVADILREEKSR